MFRGQIHFSVAAFILIVDRVAKFYFQHLPDGTVFSFFPGIQFAPSLNPALFFLPAWRFIPWLALTVLTALTVFYALRPASLMPLIPILLGGLSNIYDRFVYGGVIDYVEIMGVVAINIADIMILLGLLSLMHLSEVWIKHWKSWIE